MYLYIYIHLHAGIYHTYTCTHTSTYTYATYTLYTNTHAHTHTHKHTRGAAPQEPSLSCSAGCGYRSIFVSENPSRDNVPCCPPRAPSPLPRTALHTKHRTHRVLLRRSLISLRLSLSHTLSVTHTLSQDVTAALLKRCRSFPPAPAPWHGHPALRGWSTTLPCCLIVFIIVSLMLCSEGRVLCYNSIVRSYHALGSWQSFSPAVALSKVGGTLARPSPISLTLTTDKLRKLHMCSDLELARSLRCAAICSHSGLPRGDCSRAGFEVQLEVRDGDGAPASSSCMSSSESISPCSALNGFVASK